jgi:hypothetical protein
MIMMIMIVAMAHGHRSLTIANAIHIQTHFALPTLKARIQRLQNKLHKIKFW